MNRIGIGRRLGSLLAGVALTGMIPAARADVAWNKELGAVLGSAVTSAPGRAITLDYREPAKFEAPLHPILLQMRYQTFNTMTQVHLQLSGGPGLSYTPTSSAGWHIWYDPTYFNPSSFSSLPNAPMPDAWRTELSDGILNAGIWIDGVAPASGSSVFALSVTNLVATVPEPGGLGCLLGGLLLIAQRRSSVPRN